MKCSFIAAAAVALTVLLAAQQTPVASDASRHQADISVDVDLVTVACSVTNRHGAPVRDLKAADFKVLDNGQPREVHGFWQESGLPLTVALVADVSGSQAGFVENHREAVSQFLKQVIGPRDRAMIVEIDKQARLISGLTGSLDALNAAVAKIGTREGKRASMLGPPCRNTTLPHTCGGTALWHGLYYTADALRGIKGRKAIVVLSDGVDTGSDIPVSELIETTETVGAVVYSVKYASASRFLSVGGIVADAVSHGMERLDRETGGLSFGNPGKKTAEVFGRIEADLRNMYVIGFNPPPSARDGKFHKLEVRMARNDLQVRARSGYWSPPLNAQQ
jgi:VWFA-related protein